MVALDGAQHLRIEGLVDPVSVDVQRPQRGVIDGPQARRVRRIARVTAMRRAQHVPTIVVRHHIERGGRLRVWLELIVDPLHVVVLALRWTDDGHVEPGSVAQALLQRLERCSKLTALAPPGGEVHLARRLRAASQRAQRHGPAPTPAWRP